MDFQEAAIAEMQKNVALRAEIEELKGDLYGIQAQYEAASKEAVNYAAEIARLEAEKAELLEHLDAFRTGFLLTGATHSAREIEKILEKYGRK